MRPVFENEGEIMSRINNVLKGLRAQFDKYFYMSDRCGVYGNIIQLIGAEQFTWQGLPETTNSHCTERAVNTGLAAFYEVPGGLSAVNKGYTVTPCAFKGLLNNTGVGQAITAHGTDYEISFDMEKDKDKFVLIRNNDYFYSEYPNLAWFAEMLSRTDDSEKALIIWSKMHPIAKAQTGIEAAKLQEILQNILENDDMYNVIDDNSKVISPNATSRDDSVLRLTDENAVAKMHFLSEFHYELIRRYCTLYNMPFRTTSKSAQSLESELHNTDIFSQVINANRLKCRQAAAAEINTKFGLSVSVDFSELIKKENKIIDSNVQEEVNEAENNKNVSREGAETETERSEENGEGEAAAAAEKTTELP